MLIFNKMIYAYKDPRNGQIRYIGKSAVGIKRAKNFKSHNHGYVKNWIKTLEQLRIKPQNSSFTGIA